MVRRYDTCKVSRVILSQTLVPINFLHDKECSIWMKLLFPERFYSILCLESIICSLKFSRHENQVQYLR